MSQKHPTNSNRKECDGNEKTTLKLTERSNHHGKRMKYSFIKRIHGKYSIKFTQNKQKYIKKIL